MPGQGPQGAHCRADEAAEGIAAPSAAAERFGEKTVLAALAAPDSSAQTNLGPQTEGSLPFVMSMVADLQPALAEPGDGGSSLTLVRARAHARRALTISR